VAATSVNICLSGSLSGPSGLALDKSGDLFISDTGHNVVRERKPNGIIVTFAGTGSPGSQGDGGKATSANLSAPTGLVVDPVSGSVYIGDTGNNKVRVVNSSGIISTFAGTGTAGFSGDLGQAKLARLKLPTGIGLNSMGNVYISDTGNQRIRQVDPSGVISTYAGTGVAGFSGDLGPATAAKINFPTGLVADAANVYFGDTGNHVVRGIFTGPPPVLPQSTMAILLPITGGLAVLLGASLIWIRHRRRTAPAVAS
jgi:hypothetical protein